MMKDTGQNFLSNLYYWCNLLWLYVRTFLPNNLCPKSKVEDDQIRQPLPETQNNQSESTINPSTIGEIINRNPTILEEDPQTANFDNFHDNLTVALQIDDHTSIPQPFTPFSDKNFDPRTLPKSPTDSSQSISRKSSDHSTQFSMTDLNYENIDRENTSSPSAILNSQSSSGSNTSDSSNDGFLIVDIPKKPPSL